MRIIGSDLIPRPHHAFLGGMIDRAGLGQRVPTEPILCANACPLVLWKNKEQTHFLKEAS